jgi:hypothetical protein
MSSYLDRAKQFLQTLSPVAPADASSPNLSEGTTDLIELPEEPGAPVDVDEILDPDVQTVMPPPSTPEPLPSGEGEGSFAVADLCAVCREAGKVSHLVVFHHGTWRCWRCLRKDPEHSADPHETPDLRRDPHAP